MSTSGRRNRPNGGLPLIEKGEPLAGRRAFHFRRLMAGTLLALSALTAACTPAEIEQSLEMLSVSFEEGGLEGGLSTAGLIGQNAVMVVGMRLGSFAP